MIPSGLRMVYDEANAELKTSQEWLDTKYKYVTVLDPDGWDRKNFEASWNEPITEQTFMERLLMSTVMFKDRPK